VNQLAIYEASLKALSEEKNREKIEHEATLIALGKKQVDAKQQLVESLDRERHKSQRTLEIHSALLESEHKIALRKMEKEWKHICNGLEEQLRAQQTQVVRLELLRGRVASAGKEREEKQEREARTLRQGNAVSTWMQVLLVSHLFYFMICFYSILLCNVPPRPLRSSWTN
jgi:hypothetical protein